ncbi:DUF1360 domain-containing protein [Rhodoferax sp.]|uniref:DUF1360 domain-containing protein n=1 Tax=Rhodoferax sp. TaxID=50421 RepID=UPI0025D0ED3B|nr:DUF1360 domain-containing protein [Rhodoferax sp.]
MDTPWFHAVLGALATWRLAHLLAREDGPWDAVLRLRQAAGSSIWGQILDCFYCLSLWVAAPVALAVARNPLEWLLAWLGLSGAACLLERLGPAAPPPVLELQDFKLADLKGEHDELLRTETRDAGDPPPAEPPHTGTDTGPVHLVR